MAETSVRMEKLEARMSALEVEINSCEAGVLHIEAALSQLNVSVSGQDGILCELAAIRVHLEKIKPAALKETVQTEIKLYMGELNARALAGVFSGGFALALALIALAAEFLRK